MTVGDKALSEAVKYYTEWVYQVSVIGTCVSDDEWNAPLFTYLMTKKQFNELKRICNHQGWPPPVSRGITFLPRTIKHIITARMGKNDLTWQDCATVLSASLNPLSKVVLQKNHDQQIIVFNSEDILRVGKKKEKYRGVLIVEVTIKNLYPITAYPASEAKIRAIMKNGSKLCN